MDIQIQHYLMLLYLKLYLIQYIIAGFSEFLGTISPINRPILLIKTLMTCYFLNYLKSIIKSLKYL